jgi:hypothetical protein
MPDELLEGGEIARLGFFEPCGFVEDGVWEGIGQGNSTRLGYLRFYGARGRIPHLIPRRISICF